MNGRLWTFAQGALAGLVYGLIEYGLVILRPMIQWRPLALPPEHWKWEAILLSIYAAVGGIAWTGIGLFRQADASRRRKVTAIAGALAMATSAVFIGMTLWLDAAPPLPRRKAGAAPAQRPNVFLVILDTVRADHLSLYGYGRRTTPNLEAFARDALVYRNAISAADVTLSSVASMSTGLYPSWHGAYPTLANSAGHLDSSFHTLAEILSENGYTTFSAIANYGYLRREFGMAQGFDYYDVRQPVRALGAGGRFFARDLVEPFLRAVTSTGELHRLYRRGDQITAEALSIVNSATANSPLYVRLNYMDAHEPYTPPPPFRDAFPGRDPHFDNSRMTELRRDFAANRRPRDTDSILRHFISQYDGAIAFIDSELKRLFDGMKRAGIYDNSLIIVTSDHGEALGERGDLGHPASVHQELVHVPLLIKYPVSANVPTHQSLDMTVSGADVLPTVLETVDVPVPPTLQGRSLRTLPSDPARVVLSESFLDEHLHRLGRRSALVQRALYQDRWKFMASTSGERELYDTDTDPNESRDLASEEDSLVQSFATALNRLTKHVPGRRLPARVNGRTVEQLRSLGYIQ